MSWKYVTFWKMSYISCLKNGNFKYSNIYSLIKEAKSHVLFKSIMDVYLSYLRFTGTVLIHKKMYV